MKLIDSRRLTGPNLLGDTPGALLEVAFDPSEAAITDRWRAELSSLFEDLGLGEPSLLVRIQSHGAWLFVSGPIDQLYSLIELSELAWKRALSPRPQTSENGSEKALPADTKNPSPFDSDQLEAIRQKAKDEANPALIALQSWATQHEVSFFWDDDFASLGMGSGSQTWPVRELPDPALFTRSRSISASQDPVLLPSSYHDIPVAVITGTNGKSTNVRLLRHLAMGTGMTVGSTSTDWIQVGNEIVEAGDYSGPGGARTVLRDTRVDIAFLETARGGLLRRGAGVNRADVALITNVAEDHMGQYGIETVSQLAEAKMIVRRLVSQGGTLVLNADDPELVRAASQNGASKVCWFSLTAENSTVSTHLANGGTACVVLDGQIQWITPEGRFSIANVSEIPITLGGKAAYNVSNCLSATAVALTLGIPQAVVRDGLIRFNNTPESNPGRSNYFTAGAVSILLDYAHNVHGLRAILDTTALLGAKRRILTLSTAGDRTESEIRQLGALAAESGIQDILVSDCVGYERDLGTGGVPRLLMDELKRHDVTALEYSTELESVRAAFSMAQDGDLLILLVKSEREQTLGLIQQEIKKRSE